MHLSQLFAEDGSGCAVFLDEAVAQHNPLVEVDVGRQILGCGVRELLATARHGFRVHINPVQTINNTSQSEPAFIFIVGGSTAHQKLEGTKEESAIATGWVQNGELAQEPFRVVSKRGSNRVAYDVVNDPVRGVVFPELPLA
jgi:hypothetical protein